jgi:hypothetical protein
VRLAGESVERLFGARRGGEQMVRTDRRQAELPEALAEACLLVVLALDLDRGAVVID